MQERDVRAFLAANAQKVEDGDLVAVLVNGHIFVGGVPYLGPHDEDPPGIGKYQSFLSLELFRWQRATGFNDGSNINHMRWLETGGTAHIELGCISAMWTVKDAEPAL